MMTIHFMRPFWFLALVPALIYLIWVIYSARQNNPWRSVCDPHLLPALLQQNKPVSRRNFYCGLFLLFIIAIFALAGPTWHKINIPAYKELSSRMLVLDLSPAMLTTDLNPNRLVRAKFKIRDLIQLSQNTQMGLVVFSSEAFVAAPFSQDANTLSGMLEELDPNMMPVPGSDMSQGLTQALKLIAQSTIRHSDLLLITASSPTAESWTAAKAIREAGNQLSILAMIGEHATAQNTIKALQELAKVGGGALYLFTSDDTDIQQILKNNHAAQTIKDENISQADFWQDAGPWFCLVLIPFVLLVLRESQS